MAEYALKYQEILSFWKDNARGSLVEQKEAIISYILRKFDLDETNENKVCLKRTLHSCFFNNYKHKLNALSKNKRNFDTFESVYKKWLESDLHFQIIQAERINTTPRGHPKVVYEQASDKTRYRRHVVADIISMEELCGIAKKKLKLAGNVNGAQLINKVFDPESATELMDASNNVTESSKMTPEHALEMLITCNLTKSSYNEIRCRARKHGHDLYPSYKQIVNAKKKTYPQNLQITERKCEVSLQDLMEQTVKSLCNYLNLPPCDPNNNELVLQVKYGFDGTNTNRYKQKTDEKSSVLDYIFCSCIVPLRLVDKTSSKIYWLNSRSSSTRFCRPIKILYEKETDELCRVEEADLKKQIQGLRNIEVDGYVIGFDMMMTMIDGKVCNALHNTSSQRCFVCDTTLSQLNNIDYLLNKPMKELALQHGFSVLHAYIRFMELVLHISYRIEIKLWRVSKDKKDIIMARKKEIQDGLHETLGILVDSPTQGSGNTNDGNTARRFFNNVDIVSRITGFDEELLGRLKTILAVVSSGYVIDTLSFQRYTEETARRYVLLYDWYYMPPSMHVVLIHGHKIIQELLLPIGMLSEEAQESNNKNIKRFRDRFSRKMSRVETNKDMFQRLFLNSDPYLSLLNQKEPKRNSGLTVDMKKLLIIRENEEESEEDSDSGSEIEDCY